MQHDDLTDSRYGGNKVRKLEHLLAIAARRGGPVLTAGAIGSHHVVATAVHAARLGLDGRGGAVPAARDRPRATRWRAQAEALGVRSTMAPTLHAMPFVLARRWAALAPTRRDARHPGRVDARRRARLRRRRPRAGRRVRRRRVGRARRRRGRPRQRRLVGRPRRSGSRWAGGGSAHGGGRPGRRPHRHQRPGARAASRPASGRCSPSAGCCPPPARWTIDGRWFGPGYGHPTAEGTAAAERAAGLGIASEPTYTAKALAAAFERLDRPGGRQTCGRRGGLGSPADAVGLIGRDRNAGTGCTLCHMASLPTDGPQGAPDAVWLSSQDAAKRLGVTARTLVPVHRPGRSPGLPARAGSSG